MALGNNGRYCQTGNRRPFKRNLHNNHNTIEGINTQVKINKKFNETFMKLKEIIEKGRLMISDNLNEIQDQNKIQYRQTIYTDFVLKLKILQDNVDNIASAKLGIIHRNILTNEEIEEYGVDFQKLQNIKLGTIINKNENIIFVIRIPKDIITLQKTLLYPVGNDQNEELMFNPQEIVKFENNIYDYLENKDLKNLKISNICIVKKNCIAIFNNVSEIVEVEKGIVVVKNQNHSNFSSTCDERKFIMKWNHLVNFNNCSIKIDNYVFKDNRKELKQSFRIPNYLENIKESNKKLIFGDIVLKQIENIKEIKEIKYEKKTHYIYGSIRTFMDIIIIVIAVTLTYKRKKLKIKIENRTQESPRPKEGGVMSATLPDFQLMKYDPHHPPHEFNFHRYRI